MSARLRRLARGAWPPALVLALLVLAWDLAANAMHASDTLPGPWLVLRSSWDDRSNLLAAAWTTSQEDRKSVV